MIADPLWFVPLVVAGKAIATVAVRAATKAAATAAVKAITKTTAAAIAARVAARQVVKVVTGRITGAAAKRCYKGAAVGPIGATPAVLQQHGDGSWRVRFGTNGALTIVSASVATCLSANIR